jgi:hypothetical protein
MGGVSHGAAEFLVNVMVPKDRTPIADILDESVRMFTAQKGLQVLLDERTTRQGRAAREFHLRSSGGEVAFLWVAGDDRMFQVAVRVLGTAALPQADVRRFFDSFQLIPVVAHPRPASVPISQWKEFKHRGGRFVVRVPSIPSEQASEEDGVSSTLWSTDADDVAYTVAVLRVTGKRELPAAMLPAMLDDVARKAGASASVRRSPPFTVSGFPAQELTIDDTGGHGAFRFILAKDRMYQLSVIAPGARSAPPGETAFLTSFRVSR